MESERYDRQIRLWGHHGQSKCANSKICLINSNSLGTEVLKSLCLAGIGSFTILDSHKLTAEDVGSIFIPQTCIGKSRGDSVKNMLLDLNDEVSGEVYPLEMHLPHVTESKTLDCDSTETPPHDLEFWKQFNCVIASGFLYIDQITRLSKICWLLNTPLILCKTIGFFGSMRTQFREHIVIETHPDNVLPRFNLEEPFPELKQYFDDIDLDDDRCQTYPYLVIVYKFLRKWQQVNNFPEQRLPDTYSEKKELRKMIENGLDEFTKKRKVTKIEELQFENFLEASKALNTCFNVSSKLPEIFNHPKVINTSTQNLSRFWLIVRAIKEFGRVPVTGNIPDMTSSSEEYIKLQKIYTKRARQDLESIFGLVQSSLHSSSCSPGSSLYEETKLICKNILELKLIHTDNIHEEYEFAACDLKEEDEEDCFITIGLCLKSLDLFFSTYGRLPGCQDDQVETDLSKLKDCIKQMVGRASNRLTSLDQWSYEICRCGGAELHATSAFMGGCIAQEVIKLVTNQYVPVIDTMVYNAILGSTKSFRFRDTFMKV